ncbi:AraC-like DNA-binding protein [Pseudonocardia antarctica]|uniref:AraC-like DNA-binding protein n=1 Tax=Pseudonocardia alni TaxID=33907 RepID=A0A852W3X5_PSEA5|nr:AraC-like DNA-binding protein [Pseudonocardia antarctica]
MLRISTRDVPRADQQEFWRTTLTDIYFAVDTAPPAPVAAGFDSRLTRLEFGGLTVDRVRAAPYRVERTDRLTRTCPSDTVQICLLRRGRSTFVQEGRVAVLTRPGDFTLVDTGTAYSAEFHVHTEQVVVQVPRPIVAGVVGQVGPVTAWTMSGRSGPAAVASSALLALIRQPTDRDDPSARIAARAAAELTAGALLDRVDGPSRQPNPRAALLGRARRFMSDHLHEADLSPACVAASIPISERYLFALFADVGSTPATWLREARLERARQLLDDDPARPVQEVGVAVGIPRASHFSRLFRARYAVAPRAYRAVAARRHHDE